MREISLLGFLLLIVLCGCTPGKALEEATLTTAVVALVVSIVACCITTLAILGFGFVKEAYSFYERHITDFAKLLFYDENSPFYDGMAGRRRGARTAAELEVFLKKIPEARTVLAVEQHNPVAEAYKEILGYRYGEEVFSLISTTYNALTKYREGPLSEEQAGEINNYVCERAEQFLDLSEKLRKKPFSLVVCSCKLIAYEFTLIWNWKILGKKDTFHLPFLLRSHFQNGCLLRTNGQCSELVRG
jgi:hypothetical protein